MAQTHTNERSKSATIFTQKANEAVYSRLNFADSIDFIEANQGFIATLDNGFLLNPNGQKVINTSDYDFIKGQAPATVNPALWRHAKLNNINGLFKVVDGIYQVRSFDLAVITFIKTRTGYIVVDPCTNIAAASAAYTLVKKYEGDRPVLAVISTHSHSDHYGGIEGVANAADIKSGKVKYIVPAGFYNEAISENILLGNAMGRRAGYQFGLLLPRNEKGQIDAGLGKAYLGASGGSSILVPNKEITYSGEKINIDGIDVVFQLAPGTEAPAEMYFFLPQFKAFCPAENANRTFHNLLTPRGAKVRDAKGWAQYIDDAISLYGDSTEVVFLTHGWPLFGHARSIEFLEKQRDLYKYIHDQTVHLANQGLDMDEIAETIKLPAELSKEWYNQDFYGTVRHNSRAVYQYYLGWWDGNPANYDKLPETESAIQYVAYMGGEKAIIAKARESYAKGEYRWVAEVLKHVVFANPTNQEARNLQADAFEQIAYQSESGIWRNLYLQGAFELRAGGNVSDSKNEVNIKQSAKFLQNLTVESLFDYLSISLNGPKAAGKEISIRFIFPELNKDILVNLKNGVLHQTQKQPAVHADFTLVIPKDKFVEGLVNPLKFQEIFASEGVTYEGNISKFKELFLLFDKFSPNWNVVTP
jgi:alkyl sulfatase BDS1-like metallo-beta-lactamase superfamily hydrolase